MTKRITCIFLGSGASYALAGIPLQNQFLCSVLNEERAEWIDHCGVDREIKIGNRRLSSWMLDVSDVELCMSYLHNRADYADSSPSESKRNARRAIVNMRVAIVDYLRNFRPRRDIRIKFLKWFKKLHDESCSIVIITTNYDLILEKLLLSSKYKYHYPEISNKQEGVPIYKLHGSVNWLEKLWFERKELKHSQTRLPVVFPARRLLPKPGKGNNGQWAYLFRWKQYMENEQTHITYGPILVPFFYQKEHWVGESGGWNCIFPGHWQNAERLLLEKNPDQFYFLGYSLPPADHYMLTWLLSILNSTKPDITIVRKGTDKPTTLEKALKPFRPKVYECGLENFLDDHTKP